MLQLQYYNSNLKNNHIDKILNNYQLKYTQMKNEIDSKLNQMLKIFLKDILTFLENIEEVAEHKRKINEFDTIKKELELAKTKIKNKINIEHKLKNECDILQQENVLLKLKIKSLNNKITNLNNINLSNSFKTTSPIRISNTFKLRKDNSMTKGINISNYMSPKSEIDKNLYNSVIEESHSYNKSAINLASPTSPTSELNKNENTFKYVDKLTLKIKSLNNKITNLNNINLSNSFKTTSPIRISNTFKLRKDNSMSKGINISNYMSPKIEIDKNLYNSVIEESHSYNKSAINLASPTSPTSELNKNENTFKYVDKLTLKLNYDKKIRIKNKFYKYKNNKKINIHKFVSSNKSNKVTKDISKEKKNNNSLKRYNNKKDNIKKKGEPIAKKIISSKKKNLNSSVGMRNVTSNNRYSPVNTNNSIENLFNVDYEDLGKKINNALDNELKELEKDEENIELLLEQLNEEDNDIIDSSNND